MVVVNPLKAASQLEGVLAHRPELLAKYRVFYQSLWTDGLVPGRVLELCRRRIAYIHDCAAELLITDPKILLSAEDEQALAHAEFGRFDAQEQAALALAELMPFGVHQIDDLAVAEVAAQLGHPGCVSLLTALSFFDVNCRLKIVMGIEPQVGELGQAHLV